MKLEIMELIIRLAVLVMAGIVIPAFKKWLEAKTDNEKYDHLKSAAETAVYAAEQLLGKADPDGTERMKYAKKAVTLTAHRIGLVLTDREVEEIIEAAVKELNFFTRSEVLKA